MHIAGTHLYNETVKPNRKQTETETQKEKYVFGTKKVRETLRICTLIEKPIKNRGLWEFP